MHPAQQILFHHCYDMMQVSPYACLLYHSLLLITVPFLDRPIVIPKVLIAWGFTVHHVLVPTLCGAVITYDPILRSSLAVFQDNCSFRYNCKYHTEECPSSIRGYGFYNKVAPSK